MPDQNESFPSTNLAALVQRGRKITYGIVQPGEFVDDGVILVRGRDYSTGWRPINELKRVTAEIDAPYKRSKLNPGDLVMTIVGANTGTVAVVPDWLDGANITQTTARIAIDHQKALPGFVEQVLRSCIGQDEVDRYQKGGAQPGLNLADVEKFRIPLPPLPEQRKIAEILRTWDEAIEKAERSLVATRVIRSAEIARAISKQHYGNLIALGDLVEPVTSRVTDQSIPILTISAESGFVEQHTYFARRIASESLHSYSMIVRGEFAYNRSRANGYPCGAIKRLNKLECGAVTSLYFCFKSRSEDPEIADYLEVLFESDVLNSQLARIAKEGSRAHGLLNVGKEDFLSMTVHIPPQRTRATITLMHRYAVAEIAASVKRVELLRRQKSGLMQRLLTGEIRVPGAVADLSPAAE